MSGETVMNGTAPRSLRRLLVVAYLFGAVGLMVELLLMEHFEGIWQQLPLWFIGASVALIGVQTVLRNPFVFRAVRVMMVLLCLCGALGVYLHFDGKAEFKVEIDPSLTGWELVWECLHGHSLPPVLAPGVMLFLGMVGFATTIQPPGLKPTGTSSTT